MYIVTFLARYTRYANRQYIEIWWMRCLRSTSPYFSGYDQDNQFEMMVRIDVDDNSEFSFILVRKQKRRLNIDIDVNTDNKPK